MNHNVDTNVVNRRVNWIFTIVGETDTRKASYAIQVACRTRNKSHERGHVKLVRAASSHYAIKMQSTQTKDNKSIDACGWHVRWEPQEEGVMRTAASFPQ